MATEIDFPESVCLKKGEREDNALPSEILEENVTQLPGDKVKQLESGPNQPLELISQVAETVNTQLEIGIPTNESGTFFQSLLIPKVTADELINTPESCVATTTEGQEVRKVTDIEAFTEGKSNEEAVVAVASKEAFANEQQPNKGDHDLGEAIPAQTQGSIVHAFGKELEQVAEICYKDESVGGSLNTETEAVENEDKVPEFVKTKESVNENTEDVTPGVETDDQGLHEGATNDGCVSTEIKHEETIKNEEKNDEIKESGEESSPEKAESELSDSMVPSKKEALDMLEKDQGDGGGIASSHDGNSCEDTKEITTGQPATTVAVQDQNERHRGLIREQIDKPIDAQEVSEQCEDEVKDEGEQTPAESVKKTSVEAIPVQTQESIVHNFGQELEQVTEIFYKDESVGGSLNTETEAVNDEGKVPEFVKTKESVKENTEDVAPGVETEDQRLHEGPTNDFCVSTEIKPEEETIKNEQKNDETKEADEESGPEKAESELSESTVPSNKEAINMLEKDQGDSEGITSSQDATCEDIKDTTGQHATTMAEQDQNERPRELIKEQIEDKSIYAQEASEKFEDELKGEGGQNPEESVKKTEEEEEIEKMRPGVEIEEKMDENGLLHAITSDACISTQTKSQVETIEQEKKDEEEATQIDDRQKEKSDSPLIKEVCEENSSEKVEHEKEQEVNVLDQDQVEVDITRTQDAAFEGGLQEQNHHSEGNMVPTEVCISTKTELHEEIKENKENKDEDVVESDDGNIKSSGSPIVKEIREETVSEKAEFDEALKSYESFSLVLNDNEIGCKDEDQEKEQALYVSEKSQTESQVDTTKLEEGHEEEVVESKENQNENSDSLSIKEACEEPESEKVEPEKAELTDSSSIKLNEGAVEILNKDEVQGKEQEQVEDDATCSQDATSIEELQGKTGEDMGKEPEPDLIRESLEVDTEEMRSTVETSVEIGYQGSSNDGTTTDASVSTQTDPEKGSSKYEENTIEKDVFEETSPENAESEARLELSDIVPSKKEAFSTLEKDEDDSEGVTSSQDVICEDTKQTTPIQHASVGADFKEQDQNERPREFLKEETEDKSIDAQKEIEQCEYGENDKREENPEESVKHDDQEKEQEVNKLVEDQGENDVTSSQDGPFEEGLEEKNHHREAVNAKESIEEHTEEIMSTIEITESVEQQTLINTNATDVCISTQTEPEEAITENKEKNDEDAIGSEDGKLKKSGSHVINEINEETVSEKAESKDGLQPSESPGIVLNEDETVTKDEDQEKAQELYVSERGQSGQVDATSLQDSSSEDIKETTIGEHVTTVAYFEEGQGLSASPKEIIKEESKENSIDAQEATKLYDDGASDDVEQKEEETVNEIAHSSSKIEQEEYVEDIKPSVKTNEENDVCISTQIEFQEEDTKNEENAIESAGDQKEKSDNPLVKEACEEIVLTKTESAEDIKISDCSNLEINEKAIATLKDEDQETDQVVGISTEDQGKANVTISQFAASEEGGLQEQNYHNKGIEGETTKSEKKNDKEAIENDNDGQTKKPESPLFEEVCEATNSEKLESEVQGGGDEVISSNNASSEEIKEKTSDQHATTVSYLEDGLGESAMTEEILNEESENKSIDAREEVKRCENEAIDKREQKPEESVNEPGNSCSITVEGGINEDEVDAVNKEIEAKLDAENQADRTEDINDMEDEVVSNEKISLELGQPKEQNVEEIQACLVNRSENSEDEIKKEDEDLSHERVEDANDNTAKEEKCTLEHEPVEEQHGRVDEVSKEKDVNLNETTVEPQEDITPSSSSEIPTEDTSNSEKEKAKSEILPTEDLKTISEVQIPELVTKSEDSKLKEACLVLETATHVDEEEGALTKEISSDEKIEQTTEIKQEIVKEGCEDTSSEKAEFEEGLKLSDNSNMKISEKTITSLKDDDQEKDREFNMSAEGEGKDNVSSSQNEVSEEDDLQEKNYQNEGNDREFGESIEKLEEDTEEIKSSVGTNENTEQIGLLHVVTTDDCSSTHAEHKKETTENEEENNEEAIENEVRDKSIDAQKVCEQLENEAKDKKEQKPEELANSCLETVEGNIKEDDADPGNNTEIGAKLNAENQADRGEDGSEMKDEAVSTEKMSTELGQLKEQSVVEIQACLTETKSEKTEDDITEKDKDLSPDNTEVRNGGSTKEEKCFLDGRTREIETSTLKHEPVEEQNVSPDEVSKETFTNLNETTVEAQEDITRSSSLGTSTEDTSNSEKAKAESENLPTEDVEFVSEVQISEVVPKSEDSKPKEECLISATATYVDEEKETETKEISNDENLEPYGSTQQSENLNSTTEENIGQLEKIGEVNSVYEKRDTEEDVTQENQVNSEENCDEMVKDVILTEEVPLEIEKENRKNDYKEQVIEEDSYSKELEKLAENQKKMTHEIYSDPTLARNPDTTEVKVEPKEDISCESKVKNDDVDEAPKEEGSSSLEDAATIKPQVDLSNIESTAHLSESEKLATQVPESVCDVQSPDVVADSADLKVKEECVVLPTDVHMSGNNVEEEQKTKTYEILSASGTEQENVKQPPTKSEVKSDDLNIEDKTSTKEDLELHGELKLTSETMIEEQAIETKPQPEQPDITSENIISELTLESKLEYTSEKHLENEKSNTEEDATLAPENQIRNIENQNETAKNVILTDDVVMETLNKSGRNEVKEQISEEDNCPTEPNNTSAPDQKELANKIEYSELIPIGNTEATEVKELTSLMVEGQTNELVLETDSTKVEHSSISNRNWNPELIEEKFLKISSEDQKSIKERYTEEEGLGNFGVESKEAKSGNVVVEDVNANEAILEVEKAMESKSVNEFRETKDLIEDNADMILVAENLNVKDETFTVMKESNEDMKHNFAKMMKEEKITEADANEKETLEEPQTHDPAKTVFDSISSSTEQDVEVGSDERRGDRDMPKLEENSTEEFESTSEVTEIVSKGKDASTNLVHDLPEAFPKLLPAEQDQEITNTTEIDQEITNTTEIDQEKKNGPVNMLNIEKEAVQPQEHISDIKLVDPPSDVETREQGEVMQCGSQQPSEDNTLLSQNDMKVEDLAILQSVDKDIIQGVDKRFDGASVIDVQKHEKDFDHKGTSIEVTIPFEDVKKSDAELKSDMDATADKVEKEVLKEDVHFESTCDRSKTTEEVSEMKQEKLELDSPVTPGTATTEDLNISLKNVTDDLIISQVQPGIQKDEVSTCTVDGQSTNEAHQNESTENKLLAGKIDAPHEQGEPIAKSLTPEAEDLKSTKASATEPQCSSEVSKEEKKMNDEKEKFETAEPAKVLFADLLHEPTKGNSKEVENLIGERESAVTKDQQVDKEGIGDSEVKTDEENEEDEEDKEDNEKTDSCSDAPVMVEASKDMEAKVHKKSNNILSGVGSKVKHSIAKVKKAITGKSSSSKPASPKEKDQMFA